MPSLSERVRENKIRRVAERRGYRIEKSRRRDRKAFSFGKYAILRATDGASVKDDVLGGPFAFSLAEVETWLEEPKP